METVYPAHRASNKNVTNGGAPGLDASLFNDIESILVALNSASTDWQISSANGILSLLGLAVNPTPVVVNGTTAGTATLYQVLRGSVKFCFLKLSGYRNASATQQTIALPSPMSNQSFVLTGPSQQLAPYQSGSLQSNGVRVVTALSAGSTGGSYTVQSYVPAHSIGVFTSPIDAIGLGANQSTGADGIAFILGI